MVAPGLNGATKDIERLEVHGIDIKWLPGLTGDKEYLKMDRF